MKLIAMMSLRHASPRSFKMPSHSSCVSIVPLPSTSSVSKRLYWSSSAMSSSSKMAHARGCALNWSNTSGVISMLSASPTTSRSEIVLDCRNFLSWLLKDTELPNLLMLGWHKSIVMRNNSDIFLAKYSSSRKRHFLTCLSRTFAVSTTLSTNMATITLNSPNVMNTDITPQRAPHIHPCFSVTSKRIGRPSASSQSPMTMQRKTVKNERGTDSKCCAAP
mmetsp:Transcript_51128/g.155481  ORF Transcript_51128/g.155481 Transcript_51128/m.155481 type:complete len:220 (-) Transcript_51128:1371-2030(-)